MFYQWPTQHNIYKYFDNKATEIELLPAIIKQCQQINFMVKYERGNRRLFLYCQKEHFLPSALVSKYIYYDNML